MNKFKEAVEKTPDIKNCYNPGLRGLANYSGKIIDYDGRKIEGSVNIDDCVKQKYPNYNRWDYAIGYNSRAYFVEVHSAHTNEVRTVLNKLAWLKNWLNNSAPELKKIKDKNSPFIWLFSKNFAIPKTSPQFKQLVKEGLVPISQFSLKNN